MQVDVGDGGRGQPERRAPQQCRPATGRRQAGTHAALNRRHRHAPGVERSGAAASERQDLGQREHLGDAIRLVHQHPAHGAAPPPLERQLVGERVERRFRRRPGGCLPAVPQRADPALAARDRVGDRVTVGVVEIERVEERDAERKRVALVGGQLRRLEDALEIEAAQRQLREADIEAEHGAADVPGNPRRHLGARHRPREPLPRLGVACVEPEVVAPRDVVREHHRAVRIADVGGVRDREQHVGEHRVGQFHQRRGVARDALDLLVVEILGQLLGDLSQRLVGIGRRGHAGRPALLVIAAGAARQLRDRRGQLRQDRVDIAGGDLVGGQRAGRRGQIERGVERRPFLLLADDVKPLPLGGAEIETVRLPLPRHRPRHRAVARRRPRHRCEHRQLGGGGALDRAGQLGPQPAGDRSRVPAVVGHRQRDELLDQRLRLRGVERGDHRRARQNREPALELRLRFEPAAPVERAEARRVAGRLRVRRRRTDADAFERPHQHAIPAQPAHRHQDIRARRRVGRAKQPLAERDLVEPIGAHAHVDRSNRLDQPGGVDRFLVDGAPLARRIVREIAAAERARPEAARGGRHRRAVGSGLDARERHRQVVGCAAERQCPQMRLAVGADAERQRLEALGSRRRIRHPEAERERAAGRIELADDVVEIRQPSVVQLEQLLDEPIRARHLLEDHALPQRGDVVPIEGAGRNDTVVRDPQAGGEGPEGGRRSLVDPLEQLRVIREKPERRIVERREPEAEERCRAIRNDRRDQLARRHRAMKDRRAPEVSRQRHRHHVAGPRVQVLPSAPQGLPRRRQIRLGRRPSSFGRVVEEAGDLVHEAAAIGYGIDPERLRKRSGAAGDRHVLGNSRCRGITRQYRAEEAQ